MKLSEQLKQDHESGDYGSGLKGYSERAEQLETIVENARTFAAWIECLGRTDCEVYKHELRASAVLMLDRIDAISFTGN